MKKLLKIFAALCLLVVLVLVLGYFVVTNASFQKRMVEKNLPEGSSVKHVRVTAGSLELSGLVLLLEDGTRVKVGDVDTRFKPLAALFDNTIHLGAVRVDGLRIELPETVAAAQSPGETDGTQAPSEPAKPREAPTAPGRGEPANPFEALYQLGDFDWLLDIESLDLNGTLIDGNRNSYAVTATSGAIRPGAEARIEASLELVSEEALAGGLKEFSSQANVIFTQKESGGFEKFRLESDTSGRDAGGASLLAVSQVLDLSVNGFEENAALELSFDADLPRPELFFPEMEALGALKASGQASGQLDGKIAKLNAAQFNASAEGREVLRLDLKKTMTFGGKQNFTGELLDLRVAEMPLAWLGPWLPEGMRIEGAPVSLQMAVVGTAEGGLIVRSPNPLEVGPFTVRDGETVQVQNLTMRVDPVVEVGEAGDLRFDLQTLTMLDRYGEILQGNLSGSMAAAERDEWNPLAGIRLEGAFDVGLQELFQQPALAEMASVVSGRAQVNVNIDGEAATPIRLLANIKGLRPSSQPGSIKDFRLRLDAGQKESGEWRADGDFIAGSETRPSSSLHFAGTANPASEPMTFSAELTGPKVSQADLTILAAAFSGEEGPERTPQPADPRSSQPRGPSAPKPAPEDAAPVPPAWAGVSGTASVKIDEVILESGQILRALQAMLEMSEPRLALTEASGKIGENGGFSGSGEVRYLPEQENAYQMTANFDFQEIDPAMFAEDVSDFPVRGRFEGGLALTGRGENLEAAVENAVGDLRITGTEGVWTAFELNNRSQLGLLGVGILGESLNRPGITALSQAVPYFKDIRFDNFVFEMERGADKRVMIPQLKLTGDFLLFEGSGFIAPSSLSEVLDQPLDLTLGLGARGRLTDYLEQLNLLTPNTGEDGFRRWNRSVNIGGTLGDPDTDALTKLLNDAAKAALNKPRSTPKPATEPAPEGTTGTTEAGAEASGEPIPAPEEPELTEKEAKERAKEERRRREIDAGVDLLNSLFGN